MELQLENIVVQLEEATINFQDHYQRCVQRPINIPTSNLSTSQTQPCSFLPNQRQLISPKVADAILDSIVKQNAQWSQVQAIYTSRTSSQPLSNQLTSIPTVPSAQHNSINKQSISKTVPLVRTSEQNYQEHSLILNQLTRNKSSVSTNTKTIRAEVESYKTALKEALSQIATLEAIQDSLRGAQTVQLQQLRQLDSDIISKLIELKDRHLGLAYKHQDYQLKLATLQKLNAGFNRLHDTQ